MFKVYIRYLTGFGPSGRGFRLAMCFEQTVRTAQKDWAEGLGLGVGTLFGPLCP